MLGAARCAMRRLATKAEIVPDAVSSRVVEEVRSKIDDVRARLFAVVYINGRQFKVHLFLSLNLRSARMT